MYLFYFIFFKISKVYFFFNCFYSSKILISFSPKWLDLFLSFLAWIFSEGPRTHSLIFYHISKVEEIKNTLESVKFSAKRLYSFLYCILRKFQNISNCNANFSPFHNFLTIINNSMSPFSRESNVAWLFILLNDRSQCVQKEFFK